jgi:hypothetical protein
LGQTQKCGRVKLVNGIRWYWWNHWPSLLTLFSHKEVIPVVTRILSVRVEEVCCLPNHTEDHNIWLWKSNSWLGTDTKMRQS